MRYVYSRRVCLILRTLILKKMYECIIKGCFNTDCLIKFNDALINNWHREAWFKIVAPFSEASRDIICYKHFNESDLVNINGKHYLRKSINVLPCLKLDSKYPDRRVYLQSVFAKLSADSVSGDKTYFKVKINDPYQAQIGKNEQVCYVIPDPQPIHNEHGYAKILGSSNKQCRSRLNVVKNCKKVFQTQSQNKSMVIIEQASKNNLQESVINKTTEKDSVKPPVETTQIIPTSIKPDVQCLMCLTTNPEVSVGTQGDLTLQSMLKVMVPYLYQHSLSNSQVCHDCLTKIAAQCLNENQMMIVQNQKGTSDKWEMFIEQTRIFSKQEIFTEDLKTKQKIEVQKMNEVQMPYFKEIKEETVEMTDDPVSSLAVNPIYSLNQSNQSSKKAPPNCFKNSYEIDANGLNGVIFKTEPCITFDDYQIQEQNLQPNPIVRPKVEKISRKRLERRLERLSNARSFNCASPNCNFSVYSKKKYINHLIEHRLNDDPPPFSCRNCKRTFYSFEKNSKHCCFQSERCYICFENFHCTKLIKHLHKAHRATSLKCAVGSCVEKFESVMLLNFHIRVVHHNQQLEHKCTSCPQQFRTLINRKLHMQRCQKVKLVCDICGYVGSRNLLVYHMKTHVKLKGEIVCRDCGAVTSNINTYSFHRVRAHGAEPKFKCPDCGLGFNRLFHVNRHRNRVHLKIDSK